MAGEDQSFKGISRPQRWDVPFGSEMTEADVDELLRTAPFRDMKAELFPAGQPLRGILLNDARIQEFGKGDIVVREGDYGNSAFLILSGAVRVVLERAAEALPSELLGRRTAEKKGLFGALAQLWSNPRAAEARNPAVYERRKEIQARAEQNETRVRLQDIPRALGEGNTVVLEQGELFGELAALGRMPRAATVLADQDSVRLLEIRWQGLRDLRRFAPEFKAHLDTLYRDRGLLERLQRTPIFRHLSKEELKEACDAAVFETYGRFDWQAPFQKLSEEDAAARLENEPVIAEEGNYVNGLLIVRAGFARLSRKFDSGHRTEAYLGVDETYGLRELAHGWRTGTPVPLQSSLRAVGYVDVIRVPTRVVEKLVFSRVSDSELPPPILPSEPAVSSPGDDARTRMLEFLVDRRYMNGTATMVINLERCTRCDDCVRACAAGHDNNPRFIRHGQRMGPFMVANACLHCADPVCMIGCPTGAIHRTSTGGQVVINDITCIGCQTCANSCPYDNIRMVAVQDAEGAPLMDKDTRRPIVKATKCDLCVDQLGGPACERACPHDALKRVDMRDTETFFDWVRR